MNRSTTLALVFLAAGGILAAQPKVDFEMMTWVEVKNAMKGGKTTALIYNGGTEQRGPQNVNGGHTLMGHATVIAIAEKLGNAIAAPVMPFSVNNANAALPGTIGLTGTLFAAMNEQVAEQMIKNGFKNVVLMGDHGGGQKELGEVAKKLDEKYAPQGIRVVFCDEVYTKANDDFDKWAVDQRLSDPVPRWYPRYFGNALSRRRQGLDAARTDGQRGGRSDTQTGRGSRSERQAGE